jgi:hypothetical protein
LVSRRPRYGYPLEAKSAAYPFAPLSPATTRQGCLGSGVAMPRSGFVPFGAEQPWPEIRPADICNPTYQRRTPGASRGYRLSHFPEFPPVGSVNDAVHAAIARFGRLLVFRLWRGVVFPAEPRAPFPLTFPSPPKLCPHLCELFSNDQDHRTALERDF